MLEQVGIMILQKLLEKTCYDVMMRSYDGMIRCVRWKCGDKKRNEAKLDMTSEVK